MKLSQALADQVAGAVALAWRRVYFFNGDVRSVEAHDAIIYAVVKGSESVRRPGFAPRARLFASLHPPLLLRSDRDLQTHLGRHPRRGSPIAAADAPTIAPASVTLEPLDVDADPKNWMRTSNCWSIKEPTSGIRGARPGRNRKWYPRPRPAWRQLLDAIGGAPFHPSRFARGLRPGQLLYIIDVAASLAGAVLVIELMTRDRKANGEWGKPKPARLTPADLQALPDATERHTLERLVGARPHFNYGAGRIMATSCRDSACTVCWRPRSCRCCARQNAAWCASAPTRSGPSTVAPPAGVGRRCPWRLAVSIRRDDVARVYVIEDRWCGTPSGWR